MSYKHHKPVSEDVILNPRYIGHHTICQMLRDIYIMTDNEDIKLKCRIGVAMAKSMHEKLKAYKKMQDG